MSCLQNQTRDHRSATTSRNAGEVASATRDYQVCRRKVGQVEQRLGRDATRHVAFAQIKVKVAA